MRRCQLLVIAVLALAGCSFGGNTAEVVVDADVLPGPPDADPSQPDARPDATPPPPDARLPDAAPGAPDAPPDAMVANCGSGYAPLAGGFPAGTTYRAVNIRTTWQTARDVCLFDGADLVVIDNAAEAAAVGTISEDPGFPQDSPYYWVGVFDPSGGGDGNYTTVLGTLPPYLPWASNEPDYGNENCLLVGDFGSNQAWDYFCTAGQVYVCECLL